MNANLTIVPSKRDSTSRTTARPRISGLTRGSDTRRGITRKRVGKSFMYFDAKGRRITRAVEVQRINALAVPPAYQEVWINPDARGHLQAVGRDARGRKQYRYHARFREHQDSSKYGHVVAFALALPTIRKVTARHLRMRGLPKSKVLAAVGRVMEKTLIRVGNEEYARTNGSFGLTTLRDRHATVGARKVVFAFKGKSGVEHEIDLHDGRLVRIVRECRELPGQELFQYRDDDGRVCDIKSNDVNGYLRDISGGDFTAKDFRTWAGTVLAAKTLHSFESAAEGKPIKRDLLRAIETVAARLGNTKAVCRKCYIHPAVIGAYMDGELAARLRRRAGAEIDAAKSYELDADEASVLRMLRGKKGRAKAV